MFKFIWPLAAVVYCVFLSYFSVRNNVDGGRKWFAACWAMSLIPLWTVVSKYSRNIVFDAMLFDTLTFVAFAAFLSYFGSGTFRFGAVGWTGFALSATGFVLMQFGQR